MFARNEGKGDYKICVRRSRIARREEQYLTPIEESCLSNLLDLELPLNQVFTQVLQVLRLRLLLVCGNSVVETRI